MDNNNSNNNDTNNNINNNKPQSKNAKKKNNKSNNKAQNQNHQNYKNKKAEDKPNNNINNNNIITPDHLQKLDDFIQNSLNKFKFVDPFQSLYDATDIDQDFIISHKSTIPDLVIWNKLSIKTNVLKARI